MKQRVLPVLPTMQCDDGCGDCCGIVPVTQVEFDRIRHYIAKHKIAPLDQSHTCPLYQKGKCTVYAVRPLICQVFGHADDLTCSRGYNANIPQADVDRAIAANGPPAHLLHELIPGFTKPAHSWNAARSLVLNGE